MRFTAIDMSTLAAPDALITLDYEAILAQLKVDFLARMAASGQDYDVATLEVDPAVKILEVAAYRELILRAAINDKIRAIMLASAQDADLDQLGVDLWHRAAADYGGN